jgi:hypothetical protein
MIWDVGGFWSGIFPDTLPPPASISERFPLAQLPGTAAPEPLPADTECRPGPPQLKRLSRKMSGMK